MTNKNNIQVEHVIVPIFIVALKNFPFKCLKQPTYFDHIFLYFPMIHKKKLMQNNHLKIFDCHSF